GQGGWGGGVGRVEKGGGRAGGRKQWVPVEDFKLRAELLHKAVSGRKLRRFLLRGDAVSLHLSRGDLLPHRLRRGEKHVHMTANDVLQRRCSTAIGNMINFDFRLLCHQ